MPKSQTRLASTLLVLISGMCAVNACLLPQEDRVLDPPPIKNRPPRIMEELAVRPPDRLITVDGSLGTGGSNCSLDFSFFTEDPDLEDTLSVRFYVDYGPLFPGFVDPEQILLPTGNRIREPVVLHVEVGSPVNTLPLSRLNLAGTHVVEALVYDGRLGAGRKALPRTQPTDGGLPDPSYAVTYAWVVQVVNQCPPP